MPKLFDVERDIDMALICSNLISNMIWYRAVSDDEELEREDVIPFITYRKALIKKLNDSKVAEWDLIWIIKKRAD